MGHSGNGWASTECMRSEIVVFVVMSSRMEGEEGKRHSLVLLGKAAGREGGITWILNMAPGFE